MPDITCRACGHHLDPADATAQAGPGITAWYCRDTDACRERMWGGHLHSVDLLADEPGEAS